MALSSELEMSAFLYSGFVVDFVLVVMVLEALILIGWAGKPPVDVLVMLLPGGFLLLALRASLMGSGLAWICLWIALSLPVHLVDLWRRGIKKLTA